MRQMVHVFQKDCRHLWPTICAVLLLIALHAYGEATSEAGSYGAAIGLGAFTLFYLLVELSGTLLLFALLLLVASVVHDEAAAGTEQFWLTRPYDRANLVVEKLVFVALFASLPLLLHDIAVLLYLHLPLRAAGSLLLWKQAQLWVFLLIAATLAALTRTLAQFALAGIGTIVLCLLLLYLSAAFLNPGVAEKYAFDPRSTIYVGLTLLLFFGVAGIILILYQYFRRRTRLSVAVAVGFLCAGFMIATFWPKRLAVYRARRNASAELSNLRLRPDPQLQPIGHPRLEFADAGEQRQDVIIFPFEATGLPSDVGVLLTTSSANFSSPARQPIPFSSPGDVRFQPAGEADRFFDRTGPNEFISFVTAKSPGLKDVRDTDGFLEGELFLDGYRASRLSVDLSPSPGSQQVVDIGQEHCLLTSVVGTEKVDVMLQCVGLEPGHVSRLQARLAPEPPGASTATSSSSYGYTSGPGTWPSFFTPVNRIGASYQFESAPGTREQSGVAPSRRLDIYLEEALGRVVRDFRIEHLRPAEYDIPAWEQRGVQFAIDRPPTFGQRR